MPCCFCSCSTRARQSSDLCVRRYLRSSILDIQCNLMYSTADVERWLIHSTADVEWWLAASKCWRQMVTRPSNCWRRMVTRPSNCWRRMVTHRIQLLTSNGDSPHRTNSSARNWRVLWYTLKYSSMVSGCFSGLQRLDWSNASLNLSLAICCQPLIPRSVMMGGWWVSSRCQLMRL